MKKRIQFDGAALESSPKAGFDATQCRNSLFGSDEKSSTTSYWCCQNLLRCDTFFNPDPSVSPLTSPFLTALQWMKNNLQISNLSLSRWWFQPFRMTLITFTGSFPNRTQDGIEHGWNHHHMIFVFFHFESHWWPQPGTDTSKIDQRNWGSLLFQARTLPHCYESGSSPRLGPTGVWY